MKPFVVLQMPDSTLVQAGPGDLVGRLWTSAVCIPDERLSEAHAMVSLRGGDLRLLCLRGAIAVNGALCRDPILEAGLVFELAPGLAITVLEVRLPTRVLALRGDGLVTSSLSGVCSLYTHPPRLAHGHRADAAGWFFDDGHAWFFTATGGSDPRGPLDAGDRLSVDNWEGELVWRPMDGGANATRGSDANYIPMRIENYYDTVRFFREGALLLQLHGIAAKLFSEVMEVGQPVAWEAVAAHLWSDTSDRWTLRRRWDTTLRRLRASLSQSGVRNDLLCSDGTGCISLVAYPTDELISAT